jgi:ABC-type dipeptide/oligopeptide/nickel transport system permease component
VSVTGAAAGQRGQERLCLNEPLATQYFIFIKNVVTGDPGSSLTSGAKITDLIRDAGAKTLKLGLAVVIVYALRFR